MIITYRLGNSLYLNITNKCPCDCVFCIRNSSDGINPGESLWFEEGEPSPDEILKALKAIDFAKEQYQEIVFCGFGEPTMRLDVVIECAAYLRGNKENKNLPIRLNTNGLSDLINGKETAPLLAAYIDHVSISLNAPDAASYNALCLPSFGEGSHKAIIQFAKDCKSLIAKVTFTILEGTLDKEAFEKCRNLCDSLDIPLRVR